MSDSDGDRGEEDRDPTDEECAEPEAPEQLNDEPADSFTIDDELQEAFKGEGIQRVMGEDGMPVPVVEDVLLDAHAPPFLPEKNQICHELAEEFVVRNERGEIWMRWDRKDVRRLPNGRYVAPMRLGKPEPNRPESEEIGQALASPEFQVEPLRPACQHLLLQLIPPAQSQAHAIKQGWMQRYCMARRSVAGAFLSLGEKEMKACSLREPFDVESGEMLVHFDRTLAEKSRNRTYHRMFNVKEDLESEDKPLSAFHQLTDSMIESAAKAPDKENP